MTGFKSFSSYLTFVRKSEKATSIWSNISMVKRQTDRCVSRNAMLWRRKCMNRSPVVQFTVLAKHSKREFLTKLFLILSWLEWPFRPKTSNVNFQRVTKLSFNLPFTIHYNCTEINTFTPVLSIRIVLSCFICSFSNLNISHLYVCRKRDSKSLCFLSNYLRSTLKAEDVPWKTARFP